MPAKWKKTEPRTDLSSCDMQEVKSLYMKRAHEKAKVLKDAGIPVSGQVWSDLQQAAYAEVRAECKPVDLAVSPEQMEIVESVCQPCAKRFSKRGQAKLPIEGKPATEAAIHVQPGKVTES
jgi:hypothetical protein